MAKESKKKAINFKYLLVTRKFLLISIGLSISSVLIFFALIFPKIQNIHASRQDLNTSQRKLQQLSQRLSILENVNQLDAYQNRETINDILPSYKPLLPLIAGFEQIASDNNLVISTFDVAPGEISTESGETVVRSTRARVTNFDSMEITTSVIGQVENLNQFLEDVEMLAPLTEVSSINLAPLRRTVASGTGDNSGAFEAQLTLLTYFYTGAIGVQSGQNLPEIATISQEVLPQLQGFRLYSTAAPSSEVFESGRTDLF